MYYRYQKQSGVVLVVSLIMLLVLTLIGTISAQTSSLEEKMVGNIRDRNLAFQAAESALLAGEYYLRSTAIIPALSCANGFYPEEGLGCPSAVMCNNQGANSCYNTKNKTLTATSTLHVWEAIDWSKSAIKYDTDGDTSTVDLKGLKDNPHYIIEYMGVTCTTAALPCPASNQKKYYRVTARAVGGSRDAVVMLQSVVQLH